MTRRRWVIVGGVAAAVCGLIAMFEIVFGLVLGEFAAAIQQVGICTVFVAAAVASVRYGSDHIRPRVTVDGRGTTFRPDRLLDTPLLIAWLGLAFNLACTAVSSSRADWPHWVPRWFTGSYPFVLALVVAAVCVPRVWGQLRWGASKRLRLTPAGVELGEGLRPKSSTWAQIRSVTDTLPGARPVPSSVVLDVFDGKAIRMTTGPFTSSSTALRDLVHFYWQNPQARGELTDGSAPRRLAATLPMSR